MFKRKLLALNFYSTDDFNCDNEKEFRNFISWLENQKIRFYKIEDRVSLDDVNSPNWSLAFNKYLDDLKFPLKKDDRVTIVEWLLSVAIKYEYEENTDKYNSVREKKVIANKSDDNVLENLNYSSVEFKEGLNKIRNLLNIPPKSDDTKSVLEAVSKLICEKLSSDAIKTASLQSKTTNDQIAPLSLQTMSLGFDTNDPVINEAAKILRLLYIKDLRILQTKINETIVSIQTITANPKTSL